MKKNLFTVPLGIQHIKSYTIRLFAVFLLLLFCNLQIKGAAVDSINSQKNSQAVIYVSGGTQITGASEFSNAHIVEISTKHSSKKVISDKIHNANFSEQIIAKKKSTDQKLRLVQEKINKKVQHSYYSSPLESELVKFAKAKLNFTAVTTNTSLFKYGHSTVQNTFLFKPHCGQILKQKFYTSLSYLQMGKLRSLSLRGPPLFL